jgi:integrase
VHHPALPYVEVPAFMAELRTRTNIAASALQFVILTAVRTGEGIRAQWSEFNLQEGVWTIPGERKKSGRAHRVPLSTAALEILRDMEGIRHNEFVFPGQRHNKPLSDMSMLMMLRDMGRQDITVHGFRSSFRDWAAEATNSPREVAEAALAHVVGDKVEAAYRRGDLFVKRAKLMEAWAAHCAKPVGQAAIVQLHEARIDQQAG